MASQEGLNRGGIVIMAAGALAIFGSFQPWVQGSISHTGMDGGDGAITLGLGVLIILCGLGMQAQTGSVATATGCAILCALALGVVAWLDISDISSRAGGSYLGVGLVLIGAAAVATFVGALIPARRAVRAV